MTSDTSAPGGAGPRRGRPARALRRGAGPVLVVLAAGVTGWLVPGPPGDRTAIVPPACPAVLDVTGAPPAQGRPAGDAEQLVPMPLPQPRGPVSVRVCGYEETAAGYGLRRSVVLDPTRTAALAGELNARPGAVVPGAGRPAGCRPGPAVAVLVFRYTDGPAVTVEVPGGDCGLVATPARGETGRQDVVGRLADLLAGDAADQSGDAASS